jgi:hypothetical protein
MPEVGDRVRVPSRKVGEAPRDGVVTGVTGQLLRIRWSTGEESTMAPGPGSLSMISKAEASSSSEPTSPADALKTAKPPQKKASKKSFR